MRESVTYPMEPPAAGNTLGVVRLTEGEINTDRGSVIVADDDASVRTSLRRLLAREGYEVSQRD